MELTRKIKRFVLFAGEMYHPSGGWKDYVGSHDTLEEGRAAECVAAADKYCDWVQLVDLETGEEV